MRKQHQLFVFITGADIDCSVHNIFILCNEHNPSFTSAKITSPAHVHPWSPPQHRWCRVHQQDNNIGIICFSTFLQVSAGESDLMLWVTGLPAPVSHSHARALFDLFRLDSLGFVARSHGAVRDNFVKRKHILVKMLYSRHEHDLQEVDESGGCGNEKDGKSTCRAASSLGSTMASSLSRGGNTASSSSSAEHRDAPRVWDGRSLESSYQRTNISLGAKTYVCPLADGDGVMRHEVGTVGVSSLYELKLMFVLWRTGTG